MASDFYENIQGDENDFDDVYASDDVEDLELFDDLEDVVDYLSRPDDLFDDADALASMGWGTDEDYGYYGDDYDY